MISVKNTTWSYRIVGMVRVLSGMGLLAFWFDVLPIFEKPTILPAFVMTVFTVIWIVCKLYQDDFLLNAGKNGNYEDIFN